MAPPFTFLDRIDQLVGGPAAVATTVRQLVLPGGDRPVTRAGSAGRIPADDVRHHVVDVALGVVQERVRDGLVEALRDHFAAVREEFEMLEGEVPISDDVGTDQAATEWWDGLREALRMSFIGGGAEGFLLQLQDGIPGIECMADVALAAPVADPDAVLARVGLDAAALDAIVTEIRKPLAGLTAGLPATLMADVCSLSAGWSVEWLGAYLARFDEVDDVIREGVTYVLTDPDMLDTGAELLGLSGDAAFRAWAEERAMLSTPEEDQEAVAEVLRLATNREGGEATGTGPEARTQTEAAAGASERAVPAAQVTWTAAAVQAKDVRNLAPLSDGDIPLRVVRDADGKPTHLEGVVPQKPVAAAEPSDLTLAVSAALSALFDHGCESDKAMAAALGVDTAVVRGARKGVALWAPDDAQKMTLEELVMKHCEPLTTARDKLMETDAC